MPLRTYHKGRLLQKGGFLGGIGRIFASIAKKNFPFFKGAAKTAIKVAKSPIAKDVIDTVKSTAIETGLQTASDLLKGENIKDSVQKNIATAKDQVADSFERGAKKVAKKRKKKTSSKNVKSKKIYKDLFDHDSAESSS